ncbi:MAG TPA: peroxiredoxin-like family protein [Pirellulaceae bacterium]|nr:peroxiredoxin-like family protein [Pirellulaceae bacterium]
MSEEFATIVATKRSHAGHTLAQLSAEQPLLVTFLRHAGCTFCREALQDIARDRAKIEAAGAKLAVVSMSDEEAGQKLLAHYKLGDIEHFSDPQQAVYRAFDLQRGSVGQLLGPSVWWRGFKAAILAGHGFGMLAGDGLQMPGVCVLEQGRIVAAYRHQAAADRPDYAGLAGEACAVRR